MKTDFLVLSLFITARFCRTLEAILVHIFPQISSSFDIFGLYARSQIWPKFIAFQLQLPNSFSWFIYFLDLHMKAEVLVTEVIICTTMSNSCGLVLFLQSMLSIYACCVFSVPSSRITDDRKHNIDNILWGSSDSWCALEGIGVPVS